MSSSAATSLPIDYDKRLMLFSGRANPELAARIADKLEVDVGPVTLLISELRGVAGNVPDVYEAFGIDLSDYKMAVLKTASNFQYFDRIASGLVRADTRGPGQSDVFTLPWQRIPRPVYPLETISDWRAHSSQPGAGTR